MASHTPYDHQTHGDQRPMERQGTRTSPSPEQQNGRTTTGLETLLVIVGAVIVGLPCAILMGVVFLLLAWGLPILAAVAWIVYGIRLTYWMIQHGYAGLACLGVGCATLWGWAIAFYVTRFLLAGVMLCCSRRRLADIPEASTAMPPPTPVLWRRTIRRRMMVTPSTTPHTPSPWARPLDGAGPAPILWEETIIEESFPSS